MENEIRNFEGIWVPKAVYLSQEVCWTAKIIFMEIHSFTSSGRDCFMSNEYLASFVGISTTMVSKHINKLIKLGWIEQVSFDGRRRTLRSCMETGFKAGLNLSSRQTTTEVQGSLEVEFKHTNTVTKPDTKPVKSMSDSSVEMVPFDLFWEMYGDKKGSKKMAKAKFEALDNGTREHIMLGLPEWKKNQGQYLPHAVTFLNQARWENEHYGAPAVAEPVARPKFVM